MKRIDIFGVPGSGKTTIYKELRKKSTHNTWSTADSALKIIYRTHFRKTSYTFSDYFFLMASWLHPSKSFVPKDENKYRNFIIDHITDKNHFIEYYLEKMVSDYATTPYMKAKRMEFLISTLEDLLILESFAGDDTIVCEESATNRLFQFILDIPGSGGDDLLPDIDKFSPPGGFIFLDAPSSLILQRTLSRERVTLFHRSLTESEIMRDIETNKKKFRYAVDLLSKIGIKGIVVDTSKPMESCLVLIENYLNSVNQDDS